MQTFRRASTLAALALATFCQVGCNPTPADRCVEYEREVQAMLDRCGIVRTFHVVDPSTGMPICGRVTRLASSYNEVPRVCYPFLRSTDCGTIDPRDPLATFPPECGGLHFEFPGLPLKLNS